MSSSVYDKTDKGRDEIATRQFHLPARMRTLLVLVDGHRPLELLLSNVAGLGLAKANVDELLASGFIRLVPGTAPAPVMPAAEPNPASARARAVARQVARAAAPAPVVADNTVAIETAPASAHSDAVEQVRLLYTFYNRNIRAALGLKGVMLQLKVEKAAGIEGLRDLRTPFLEAVIKAKGGAVAATLRDELDQLLGGAPANDVVAMPAAKPASGAFDFFNMANGAVEY
jgi:hypothetical protein